MYTFQQKLKYIKEEIKKMEQRNIRQHHHGKYIYIEREREKERAQMSLLHQHIIEEGITDHSEQEEKKLQQSWEE